VTTHYDWILYDTAGCGLAIGGLLAYSEPEKLSPFGLILNVAWELNQTEPLQPREKLGEHIIEHVRLDDNYDVGPQVPEILRAVGMIRIAHEAGKNVLVTCAAGRNRSALVVAEYMLQHTFTSRNGWPEPLCAERKAEIIIDNIRRKRAHALGNEAFVEWLKRAR
jgi:hypothetical protein